MINKQDILSFTFNEHFNLSNAEILVSNWDKIIEQLPLERQNKIKEKAREFDPLNALKKIIKNKSSINSVKYSFSKSSKSYGRLFAKSASLQGLPREFRSLLAKDYYYDIDYVNCHPCILEQYCLKKSIRCDNLSYYNKNRDKIIDELQDKLKLDKGEIKNVFLTFINGGNKEGLTSISSFMKSFKDEMRNISKIIVQLNPQIFKQVKRSWGEDYSNLEGKVINRILCDIENTLLLTAVDYLTNKGYNIDCLIFDGFLIRIDENKTISSSLFDEVSKYVDENTGYNLKLVHKDFDNIINLNDFELEKKVDDLKEQETYYKDKEDFERNHFKIMCPPSYTSVFEDGELYIQSTETFRHSYSHKITSKITLISGKPALINEPFTFFWYKDPNIRVYKKADFYPNIKSCPIDVYNLFNGFEAEKYEPINNLQTQQELIEPIINQLKVIAQENYIFLIIYYAFIIQYPECKTNVNIIITGKDGTGKSIINDFYREKILGQDISSQTDDTDELFGKFSNIYVKKLFLQIDEISKEDFSKKKLEKLKNITTSKTVKYEKKGFDSITINNYINIVMTTNNDFTVPISQTDRRNIFFKCDDIYMKNFDYWTKLSNHLKRNDVARAFYEFLRDYDLSTVFQGHNIESGLQFIRPITEMTTEIKSLCLPYNYRFLSALTSCNLYHDNDFEDIDGDLINQEREDLLLLKAHNLYELYIKWFEKCRWLNSKPSSIKKFFMDIKDVPCIKKIKRNDAAYYIIIKKELKDYLETNKLFDEDSYIY
jgi:hypothetical protein